MATTAPPRRPYPPRPAPGIDGAPVPGPAGATSRRRQRQGHRLPDLPSGNRPMAAGRVLVAVLVALVLGALLNADSLWATAQQQPYGWRRTVAVGVMRPVHAVADLTALDRPRAWLEQAVKGDASGPAGPPPEVRTDTTAVAAPPTTVPPPPRVREPSSAEPLRVWVGGDSMSQVFGESLLRMAEERGDVAATHDYTISSGLTRPDFFDWPAHLAADVLPSGPEVLVIMFGANDAQPLNIDGVVRESSDPEWLAEYRRRVATTMDLLGGDGRFVVWVGQPIMRSSDFSERIARLNAIYREEAANRPWIHFLDTWALFSDAGGGYSDYLADDDGDEVLMRQQDGIHLTREGGDRLAAAVLGVIDEEAQAATPGTTSTTAAGG